MKDEVRTALDCAEAVRLAAIYENRRSFIQKNALEGNTMILSAESILERSVLIPRFYMPENLLRSELKRDLNLAYNGFVAIIVSCTEPDRTVTVEDGDTVFGYLCSVKEILAQVEVHLLPKRQGWRV